MGEELKKKKKQEKFSSEQMKIRNETKNVVRKRKMK